MFCCRIPFLKLHFKQWISKLIQRKRNLQLIYNYLSEMCAIVYLLLQKPLASTTMDNKKDLGLKVLFFKIHIFYVFMCFA